MSAELALGTPAPLYTDPYSTLYLGDALDVLPTLPRGSVELLATDPPFGVSWRSNRRREPFAHLAGDESTALARAVLAEALPVLRNRRHLYVFGPESIVDGLPIGASSELVWDRMTKGSGDLTSPWGPSHDRLTFATYVNDGKRARETSGGRLSARLRRGSIIAARRPHGGGADHPTRKPVELMRQLVESSTTLGETVLDPCAGTGATGVAAVLAGRRAVLIELDETFAARAAERLAEAGKLRRAMDRLT
jgi:site-specific DNA-methyltransferase (adenine-specific)